MILMKKFNINNLFINNIIYKMFNDKYLILLIPLIISGMFYLLKLWNEKNMEIVLLDEKDIKNQIESGLSKKDKYLGQIAQPYPEVLKPN